KHVVDFVKVCDLDELPPGKGKVVRAFGREVRLFNRAGRVFATLEEHAVGTAHEGGGPPGELPPVCRHPGSHFDAEQEDSPARAHAHEAAVRVRLGDDGVYLAVEEGPMMRGMPP